MPAFSFSRSLFSSLVATAVALFSALFAVGAQAQMNHGAFKHRWVGAVPMDEISSRDIAQALMWTGHLGIGLNKAVANDPKKAIEAWQKSKKYAVTEELTEEQTVELVKEGLKKRDSFGWAILRDKSIGFEVGLPTRLTKPSTPYNDNSSIIYVADGDISHLVAVDYGSPNCGDIGLHMRTIAGDATLKVRLDDGFVFMKRTFETVTMGRAACHPIGMVTAVVQVPASSAGRLPCCWRCPLA